MLRDIKSFRKIYIATGYTDLRKGIDGLSAIVKMEFDLTPFEKDVLFLFCGRKSDRIKGLVWEGDGFCLLYKRIEDGRLHNVAFTGGCDGNLKAIGKLLEGADAEFAIRTLKGNDCAGRGTSCADQLTKAIEAALQKEAQI